MPEHHVFVCTHVEIDRRHAILNLYYYYYYNFFLLLLIKPLLLFGWFHYTLICANCLCFCMIIVAKVILMVQQKCALKFQTRKFIFEYKSVPFSGHLVICIVIESFFNEPYLIISTSLNLLTAWDRFKHSIAYGLSESIYSLIEAICIQMRHNLCLTYAIDSSRSCYIVV